jgi:hypothetical protein
MGMCICNVFAAIAYCKELDWLRTCVTTLCEEILLWFILSEKLPPWKIQTGLRSQNKERQYLQILNWRVSISICFFFCTVHPLFSLVSCSGRAASSRSMDSSWEFTLESHAKPVLASLWAPVDASLWAHTSTTLHLKKGHDTFRLYILHRDIRTERAWGDAWVRPRSDARVRARSETLTRTALCEP